MSTVTLQMSKSDFINHLAEILEVEPSAINENTDLTNLETYDSLMILAMIALIDEKFDKVLDAEKLVEAKFVFQIMDLIGRECFH